MIRQRFIVDGGLWKCAGCAATFSNGVVEHPDTCPEVTTPARCKHDLVTEQCTECMPKGPKQVGEQTNWGDLAYIANHSSGPRFGPWIVARYNGVCGSCMGRISEGERIRADDELGEFVCEACGSEGG